MSIANLKKYSPELCRDDSDRYADMREDVHGGYVKFEEAMEASSKSLQQLKAEIAAIANELESYACDHSVTDCVYNIVEKMRQLSAV